jgi:nitroreductase
MDFFDCVLGRRTCRRFRQDPVPESDLERIVDAGRYAPSGFNKQPQRFAIISSPGKVAEAFQYTGWLTGAPGEGERPAAYVAVLNDNDVLGGEPATHCATYAVMLAAWALGYGSCWHGVSRKAEMSAFLGLAANIEPRVLVSLGVPAEEFELSDPGPWQVKKLADGLVTLGKLARDEAIVARL